MGKQLISLGAFYKTTSLILRTHLIFHKHARRKEEKIILRHFLGILADRRNYNMVSSFDSWRPCTKKKMKPEFDEGIYTAHPQNYHNLEKTSRIALILISI